jgi:DNA-binding NtrC family response regulator
VLSTGATIGVDLVPDQVRSRRVFRLAIPSLPADGLDFNQVMADFAKRLIESTLEEAGGVQKRAAELLHLKPTTLNEMIKRYDIRPRRRKGEEEDAAETPVELRTES